MKRFDKGYIYAGLLTDFFASLVFSFVFLEDFLFGEDANFADLTAALLFFAAVFGVIYLFLIGYRILYYRASGYELTETEIRCNRGVLFRKRSLLEYQKIHAINKKQNLIQRLFGIAVLTVDSGSANTSHQAEITIIEKAATVDALLSELNALKESGVRTNTAQPEEKVLLSDRDSLYRFTSGKKMLYAAINIASTAFFIALFAILTIIVLGICKAMLQLDSLGTWGEYFLFATLITIGAMLLCAIFAFIGSFLYSFVGYYNFTIKKSNNNLQISYGLLEKHTNTFSYDRIKAVKISQGLVQRMLGFATIKLEVIGYTTNGGENSEALGVLVPFCKYDEIGEILGKVLPDYIPDQKQTRAVSYFPFVSWFACILGIITGVVLLQTIIILLICQVAPWVILTVALAIIGAATIILLFKAWDAALSYQNNGLAVCDGKVTAYYGGFTKNITVFMSGNLIAAECVTTPLRKKAGITSLVMHLKTNALSNEIKVHMQADRLSEEIEQLLTLSYTSDKKPSFRNGRCS